MYIIFVIICFSNTIANEGASFSLNSQTGMLTSATVFDYESRSMYTLQVIAMDSGRPAKRAILSLRVDIKDINESPPVFEPGQENMSVNENVDIGTRVGSARAHDSDAGRNGEINYYITGGNEYGVFGVNITTGLIYVERPVDYEMATAHSLQIR